MPQLHARGVEIMLQLLEAADQIDRMPKGDVQTVLREAAAVLGELLKRDVVAPPAEDEQG